MNRQTSMRRWYMVMAVILTLMWLSAGCGRIKIGPNAGATATPTAVQTTSRASGATPTTVSAAQPTVTSAPASPTKAATTPTAGSVATVTSAGTGSTPTAQAQVLIAPTGVAATPTTPTGPTQYVAPTPSIAAVGNYVGTNKTQVWDFSDVLNKEGASQTYILDLTAYPNGGTIALDFTAPKDIQSGSFRYLLSDPTGHELASDYAYSGDKAGDLVSVDKAGSYPLKITADGGFANSAFTMKVSFTANGENASADKAAAIKAPAEIKSKLVSQTDHNWYALDLKQYANGGLLTILLTMPSKTEGSGAYSMLLDESNKVTKIDNDYAYAGDKASIVSTVKKGDILYLDVYADQGFDRNQPYTVNISWVPNAANYTADTAAALGLPASAKGWMNSGSDQNWYKLDLSKLSSGSMLNVTLTMPAKTDGSGSYTIDVIDGDKTTRIANSYAYAAGKETVKATINKPGIVYVKIASDGAYNFKDQYNLTIEVVAPTPTGAVRG